MAKEKEQVRKFRGTPGDVIFNIINYTIFGIFAIICFFPFYYLFINTISNNDMVRTGQITFYPIGIHFRNYIALRQVGALGTSALVSVARTLIGTSVMVIASAFVGYLVTKQEMWGRKFCYRMLLITMYFNAGLIPTYLTISMLGLIDSFWVYIIPGIISPYNIMLVKTYIENSIPNELEESAKIDGASYLKIWWNIILPLSKPILATIAIFGAVGHWNSFIDSMLYIPSKQNLWTLQYRLYTYLQTQTNLQEVIQQDASALQSMLNLRTIQLTVAMVTILPILFVYPFMQRYFEKGIMIGAVKG